MPAWELGKMPFTEKLPKCVENLQKICRKCFFDVWTFLLVVMSANTGVSRFKNYHYVISHAEVCLWITSISKTINILRKDVTHKILNRMNNFWAFGAHKKYSLENTDSCMPAFFCVVQKQIFHGIAYNSISLHTTNLPTFFAAQVIITTVELSEL